MSIQRYTRSLGDYNFVFQSDGILLINGEILSSEIVRELVVFLSLPVVQEMIINIEKSYMEEERTNINGGEATNVENQSEGETRRHIHLGRGLEDLLSDQSNP
jgi:hypothetical protein